MFDKKVPAEALILADEGSGAVTDTDVHGVHWDHHTYIVEVRPAGGEPFRVETKAKVPIFHKPQPGDVVRVGYDPESRKTEIRIEGDPRYDPKLIRARGQQERSARKEALLNGAPVPTASGAVHHIVDDEPRWTVPATCPSAAPGSTSPPRSSPRTPCAGTAPGRCPASPPVARTTRTGVTMITLVPLCTMALTLGRALDTGSTPWASAWPPGSPARRCPAA